MSVLLCKSGEAGRFDLSNDPTGLWLSIKLDGVRAYRPDAYHHLFSRNGNQFPVPDYFFKGWPNIPMDGELWLAHNKFEETSSIVRNGSQDKGWSNIKFCVFDIPVADSRFPAEKRWETLQDVIVKAKCPNLIYVPQTRCKGKDHLVQLLDLVVDQGAEGLMLRKPNSVYEPKRSNTIFKLKKFIDDEAVVYGYEAIEINTAGKEHLRGAMGALLCRMKHPETGESLECKVGTGFSDEQRLHPPHIGSTITLRHQGFTKDNKPRFTSFKGERNYE